MPIYRCKNYNFWKITTVITKFVKSLPTLIIDQIWLRFESAYGIVTSSIASAVRTQLDTEGRTD